MTTPTRIAKIVLTLTVLGLNFLGDALRDVLDPRLQREMMRRNL